ncbi:MAG: hypothetical protein ABII21_00600 [bacterium]
MGRLPPPDRRTYTPFLDGARNGDPLQERLFRIAVSHGYIDVSQTTNCDPAMLTEQIGKSLSPAQINAIMAELAGEEESTVLQIITNPRVSQWLPGGNKSRVAKHK